MSLKIEHFCSSHAWRVSSKFVRGYFTGVKAPRVARGNAFMIQADAFKFLKVRTHVYTKHPCTLAFNDMYFFTQNNSVNFVASLSIVCNFQNLSRFYESDQNHATLSFSYLLQNAHKSYQFSAIEDLSKEVIEVYESSPSFPHFFTNAMYLAQHNCWCRTFLLSIKPLSLHTF